MHICVGYIFVAGAFAVVCCFRRPSSREPLEAAAQLEGVHGRHHTWASYGSHGTSCIPLCTGGQTTAAFVVAQFFRF